MKLKIALSILLIPFLFAAVNGNGIKKRPRELRFYVDSHLSTRTMIDYNENGEVLKMTSYENGRIIDYAKYKYDSNGRLTLERVFDSSNILLRTRKYFYNESGDLSGERVYSPSDKLIEYLKVIFSNKKIKKIEYYKPDNNLYQTIEYSYKDDLLTIVVFNKIGKYIMIMKAVYDRDMLLIGHSIKHSNADIKIETEYVYEDGYATDQAFLLIFK